MPARIPLGWYEHKPRVIRRAWKRTLATVSPSLACREWLWTIDRLDGGIRVEHAHGRCRRRRDAVAFAETAGKAYDRIFVAANRARYMQEAGV